MIKVLIVDDSPTARLALRQTLEHDAEIYVVGEAATAAEALRLISRNNPDLITMDVYLAQENGIDVVAEIMASFPRPILVVTGINPKDPQLAYRAVKAGALEVTGKLPSPTHPDYLGARTRFTRLVKTLSRIPVVRRFDRLRRFTPCAVGDLTSRKSSSSGVVLIGASTGGPVVISNILASLPRPFPLPLFIVQHIASGFASGFADWLASTTKCSVQLVEKAVTLQPDTIYVASDRRQLLFTAPRQIEPVSAESQTDRPPSIDLTFCSAAACGAKEVVAILLTGMGKDGVQGLAKLRSAGALTVVQRPETCIVDSMPRSAISIGAACSVLRPEDLRTFLDTVQSRSSR